MLKENLQQYKFSDYDYDYDRDFSSYGTFRSQNEKGSGRHGLLRAALAPTPYVSVAFGAAGSVSVRMSD
jgi:hypothetical protein